MESLVDIGANLAHDSFDDDRDEVLQRAADAGVSRIVVTVGHPLESTPPPLADRLQQRVRATARPPPSLRLWQRTEFSTPPPAQRRSFEPSTKDAFARPRCSPHAPTR